MEGQLWKVSSIPRKAFGLALSQVEAVEKSKQRRDSPGSKTLQVPCGYQSNWKIKEQREGSQRDQNQLKPEQCAEGRQDGWLAAELWGKTLR